MSEGKQQQSTYKGWLYKWTNYLKGYQKRWFVLQNGLLSYYRNQAEMTHTCRGTINLATAFIHIADSCTIVISSGGNHTFHLKATSEVDRQKWVTALELAKADAVRMLEPDSDEDEGDNDIQTTIKALSSKLEDLNTCNDLIAKHGNALQRALTEVEQLDGSSDVSSKVKVINERATMFRITSNAMINACVEFSDLCKTDGKRWHKMLENEYAQKLKLQELLEQLAKDQNTLEIKAKKSMHVSTGETQGGGGSGSEEDDFEDALDYQEVVTLPKGQVSHRRTGSDLSYEAQLFENEVYSTESDADENEAQHPEAVVYQAKAKKLRKKASSKSVASVNNEETVNSKSRDLVNHTSKRQRRAIITQRPSYSLNLWGIMKNCIGKELSKIPMPVNFSEPLSMLQRLAEDFEYSSLLDDAATCEDSTEQMAYVTAFTVSSYSTTINRTTKPFNPLLGETYECDRTDDMGWRLLAEQVSHHPPTAAICTEGRGWKLWQEFTMNSKFRGRYLQIVPTGIAHLLFKKSGNRYTWRKVTSTVHNIIVGRLWVDHHGEMDIVNHKTKDKCHLKYYPYSYFSREKPRKVTGVVTDHTDTAKWVVTGTWDTTIETAQILHVDESTKRPVFATGPKRLLWKRVPPPPGSDKMYFPTTLTIELNEKDPDVAPTENIVKCLSNLASVVGDHWNCLIETIQMSTHDIRPGSDKMYFFTTLAIELNEKDPDVAPTDSRNRPDQRAMEDGNWDEANQVKVVLEEKQRARRKQMEAEADEALKKGTSKAGLVWERDNWDEANQVKVVLEEKQRARRKQMEAEADEALKKGTSKAGLVWERDNWDEANQVKVVLEEKQRARRKQMEAEADEALKKGLEPPCHKPAWFDRKEDDITGELMYVSNDLYWTCKEKKDWSTCPNIYL